MDFESQMDTMRIFKNAAVLRVAVCELLDMLPLMKASDALTAIAEVILQKTLDIACQHLTNRHGSPSSKNVDQKGIQFAIVAYGKLGGIELAYGSDLDLVFLYDADIHRWGKTSQPMCSLFDMKPGPGSTRHLFVSRVVAGDQILNTRYQTIRNA